MNILIGLLSFILVSSSTTFASEEHEKHEHEKSKTPITIGKPTESLNKYYPPQSQKFEWVEVMHGMSGGFNGAWIDAKQGQWENAVKNAEVLYSSYKKAYEMVDKEWQEKYFKLDAAETFKQAVSLKNMNKMGKATEALGETCGKCHYEQYSNVWLKYYWDDFDSVKLEDPVTGKKFEFEDYKHLLVDSFYMLMNDGYQGDASAVKSGKEFVKRYKGLKASCMKCHEDEQVKYFFVGGKVEDALNNISSMLKNKPLNMETIMGEIMTVGREGCKKCHLTHRMAAILKKGQE